MPEEKIVVSVRLSLLETSFLDKMAKKNGMTRSASIRNIVIDAMKNADKMNGSSWVSEKKSDNSSSKNKSLVERAETPVPKASKNITNVCTSKPQTVLKTGSSALITHQDSHKENIGIVDDWSIIMEYRKSLRYPLTGHAKNDHKNAVKQINKPMKKEKIVSSNIKTDVSKSGTRKEITCDHQPKNKTPFISNNGTKKTNSTVNCDSLKKDLGKDRLIKIKKPKQ